MELTHPLDVVDKLFAEHVQCESPPVEWGERAHFLKALGLDNEEAFHNIPCLNDVELTMDIRPFSLVRYRAMVQDVFEPEMYVSCVEERDIGAADSNGSVLRTTKYRDYVEARPGKMICEGGNVLGERGAYYCVPLPGETTWAREAAAALGQRAKSSEATMDIEPVSAPARAKRARDDEDVDLSTEDVVDVARCAPARSRRSRTSQKGAVSSLAKGDTVCNADEFGLNFPLPWEESRGRGASTACIVKTYDADAESLRLCEIVEVVGVLCINPELANLEAAQESAFGPDARHPSTSLVPRLHAMFVRKLPFYHPAFPFTPQWLSEARLAAAYQASFSAPGAIAAVRGAALAQLAQHLGGDALAAEYALMSLFSRSFKRYGDQYLGCWSLNLAKWPQELDAHTFAQAAGELVPRAVCLDVDCQTLSERRWSPTKDYEANRLLSAQLQLAPGTLLVLDETKMGTGTLHPSGVKSIKAIGNLVTDHSLACDFSAYDVNIPLELFVILVSQGRSIVKDVDLTLPMQTASISQQVAQPGLDAARLYIGLATRLPRPLGISEELSQRISGDFSEARQEFNVPSTLCNSWLSLARAMCISYGEADLSEERWASVFELERQRLQRCSVNGMVVPA